MHVLLHLSKTAYWKHRLLEKWLWLAKVSPSFHLVWDRDAERTENGDTKFVRREVHSRRNLTAHKEKWHQTDLQPTKAWAGGGGMNACHKLSITTVAKHNWHSSDVCKSQRCRVTAVKQQWQMLLRFRMQINLIRSCKEGCGHSQAESNCTQTEVCKNMHETHWNTAHHRHTQTPVHRGFFFFYLPAS